MTIGCQLMPAGTKSRQTQQYLDELWTYEAVNVPSAQDWAKLSFEAYAKRTKEVSALSKKASKIAESKSTSKKSWRCSASVVLSLFGLANVDETIDDAEAKAEDARKSLAASRKELLVSLDRYGALFRSFDFEMMTRKKEGEKSGEQQHPRAPTSRHHPYFEAVKVAEGLNKTKDALSRASLSLAGASHSRAQSRTALPRADEACQVSRWHAAAPVLARVLVEKIPDVNGDSPAKGAHFSTDADEYGEMTTLLLPRFFAAFCARAPSSKSHQLLSGRLVKLLLRSGGDYAASSAAFIRAMLEAHFSNSPVAFPQRDVYYLLKMMVDSRNAAAVSRCLLRSAPSVPSAANAPLMGWTFLLLAHALESEAKGEPHLEEHLHENCTCARCGISPIIGPRYRSVNLPDYDLCSLCESATGSYPDPRFVFLKIPKPLPLPLSRAGTARRAPFPSVALAATDDDCGR